MSPQLQAVVAVVIAVAGTLCYAYGIAAQQATVAGQPDGVGIRQFFRLFTNRAWLLGMLGIAGSALCHFVALTMAPINVVQPIGILAIIWAVLLEDHKRKERSPRRVWVTVFTAAIALTIFVLATVSHAVPPGPLVLTKLLAAALPILGLAVVLGIVGMASRRRWVKTLVCAASAACVYGLATGLIKVALVALGHFGVVSPWFVIPVLCLAVLYPTAAWVLQQSFGAGAASVGVGTMTTTDPVMAVVFGLVALGEGAALTALDGTVMVISGAVAITGIILLSKMRSHVGTTVTG